MVTEEISVNLGEATPRRLLVNWANGQDAWVRVLTAETILSRKELSDDALSKIYSVFLAEKGLSDLPMPEVPKLELEIVEATDEDSLELAEIREVKGVNALAADQVLAFDSDLTILFGQNGSGKTGYSRILKRISAVRTPEDILPNAHASDGATPPPPSACIEYRQSGEEKTAIWKNEPGLTPFTRISVFDAEAVSLHIDSELGYVFTPAELALFSYVAKGLQGVQQRIAAEVAALKPGTNSLLARFARETTVYPVIETLGATTDLTELSMLATVPEDAETLREGLQSELSALRANTLDALVANAQQSQGDLARLHRVVVAIQSFDAARYESALAELAAAEQRRREAREQLFSPTELLGDPDEEWQKFVVAGDAYRRHLEKVQYPEDGDPCLYCMQELSPAALSLLNRYRTFLDETVLQQVVQTRKALQAARLTIDATELTQALQYSTAQGEVEQTSKWATEAVTLLTNARTTIEETAKERPISNPTMPEKAGSLAPDVASLLSVATDTHTKLADDRANAETLLVRKQRELVELEARMELQNSLDAARAYVQRAKRAQQLEKLSRSISSGASKQLTVQSKLASEDLVNKNFEALFIDECRRLRAPKVALSFQGRSGRAERKKAVANYRPSSILSEGEQKVLAIADFLAESRMRGTKAPLVFDDPVTSLDYRRLDEVAARIQQLSERHQVIVLTHNIMFASALISERQNKKLRVKVYEVRDGGAAKGILAPDVEPRFDTPADLAKRVNTKLQSIPRAEPVLQDALIKETYDLIRAWCEAFVEQELLQNVTQRYRANIMMTRLAKIDTTRFDAAVEVIAPLFRRACDRMTGHSHAAEYMSTKPTITDLQEDWEAAKAARAAYIAS